MSCVCVCECVCVCVCVSTRRHSSPDTPALPTCIFVLWFSHLGRTENYVALENFEMPQLTRLGFPQNEFSLPFGVLFNTCSLPFGVLFNTFSLPFGVLFHHSGSCNSNSWPDATAWASFASLIGRNSGITQIRSRNRLLDQVIYHWSTRSVAFPSSVPIWQSCPADLKYDLHHGTCIYPFASVQRDSAV